MIDKRQAIESIDRIVDKVRQTGKPATIVYDTDARRVCSEDDLPAGHWCTRLWRVDSGDAIEAEFARIICTDMLSEVITDD